MALFRYSPKTAGCSFDPDGSRLLKQPALLHCSGFCSEGRNMTPENEPHVMPERQSGVP